MLFFYGKNLDSKCIYYKILAISIKTTEKYKEIKLKSSNPRNKHR